MWRKSRLDPYYLQVMGVGVLSDLSQDKHPELYLICDGMKYWTTQTWPSRLLSIREANESISCHRNQPWLPENIEARDWFSHHSWKHHDWVVSLTSLNSTINISAEATSKPCKGWQTRKTKTLATSGWVELFTTTQCRVTQAKYTAGGQSNHPRSECIREARYGVASRGMTYTPGV